MLVIRSEKIRNMLRIALPFAIMPAIVLLLPLGIQSQYYALVSFVMVLLALQDRKQLIITKTKV